METTPAKANYSFESQAEEEKPILLLRSHIVTNVPWVVITIILFFIPMVVAATHILDTSILNFNIPDQALAGFLLIWYLFVFAYTFQNFLSWYFNIYLITNERIIDMDFFQLLYRKISSAEFAKIEDITYSTGGVSQVLFNYGDVTIQTAGEEREFKFLKIPSPGHVQKILEEAIDGKKDVS